MARMTKEAILESVREAYSNAVKNGYDLDSMLASEVATDMQSSDSDLENQPYMAILEAVRVVQASRLIQG